MKVLFIRFSSIGDIVLTSPIVRCVKLQLNAEIHFVTKTSFVKTIADNPYIDKVWTIDQKVAELASTLFEEQFDYVIDLHKNLRSRKFKKLAKIKYITFEKLNIEKWMLVNLKVNLLPKIHIVDRYFNAVKQLGVIDDGQGLDYYIPESTQLPNSLLNTDYIVIVVGAAHETKAIKPEIIIDIINHTDKNIVLLGGKGEVEKALIIKNSIAERSRLFDFCGATDLYGSAMIIKHAALVITPDTGMMHIAAALQKKIISIWGSTVPAFGMYPYYGEKSKIKAVIIENNQINCRPCSKIGFSKCPKGHFKCMSELNVAEIQNKIRLLTTVQAND
ncbi:MAG: glycosyltransferase family 9 protein [Saprospiraceae bacterium]|nr:glycosyltransferase family 9 protein [Saprospiraceae bacterium]